MKIMGIACYGYEVSSDDKYVQSRCGKNTNDNITIATTDLFTLPVAFSPAIAIARRRYVICSTSITPKVPVLIAALYAPRDKVSTISSQRGFSNSNITVNTSNCYPTSADTACNTELNGQIRSRRSSKLKIDTERGKISCSPALLEYSFDSGIGMGSSSFTGNVSVVDEKLTSKTENIKTLKSGTDIIGTDIDSVSGNDAVDFNGKLATFVSIDNGISKYSKEEISWKLRYERLQQCRLILFALDRQQTQYRQLRERLSKIGEGRIAKKEPVIDNICNVCSCPINIIDSKSFITCFVCKKRICHATKCSNFVPKSGRRECQICHFSKDSLTHTQSWITEQMFFSRQNHSYPVRARSEIYIPIQDYNEGSTNFESVSQVGANCFAITSDQKTKIREYVEEVVAKLLGNSLDQIRVTQLSKSENYLPGILNNHVIHQHPVGLNDNQTKENILSEFSEISQARLRNMVESIIAEMLGTSGLTNVNVSEPELNTNTYGNGRSQLSHRHRTEHSFEPKAYQDFLAKAVLNKIADNEGYIRKLSESTPDLSSCNIDINFNMDDRSISPESSLETTSPFNYTDAQHSSKIIKDLDRESTINDYIASHTVPLPDLSTPMTDYEEDDMASVSSSILVEGNWEDNWLFRKKRPSLTTSITGSVGMLVPAPKDDVRAQIGDKTTDEISDLSEIDSDTDDSVQICAGLDPYNDRIVNKHLIGGQNTKVILDELIETASLISNTSHSPNEANYIETRNDHIVEKSLKTEAFNSKVANHSPLELKISSKSMPTSCYEAHTAQESENNPISAPLQATESIEVDESCTGFSSVEIFEEPGLSHDTRSICQGTSVIEILAAITLAPLLAVPASEQPSIQAPFEMNAIKELSDLALAEIKLRIPELSHHSLDIIDEEEETKVINSLEINESCSEKCVPLSDIKENMNSPLIPNAITNLADENDLHELANKICAETHSPDITKVLLPSSLERTSFEDSNRSNITQLPELKTYSIEEPSNVILLHSEAESQLSSKPIIRCSSHEEPFETIYSLEKEIPKISTEAVIGIVKETKGILSSEATQSFEFEKQVPYNETRDEPESETPADNSIDTDTVKLNESENQYTSNEPKIERNINAKNKNEKHYIEYTDERNNEADTKESSETPDTHIPDKQEPISESTGECIMDKQAIAFSVTDNGTQNPCSEPEVETVMGTECENPTPSTHQVEKCAIEKEVPESSQTLYILVTDKLQSVCELPGDKNMDTEAGELSEIEKQIACNEPEIECAKYAQSENKISYIDHKNEHDNEVETQESSESPDTHIPDKQEPIRSSTEESIMNTELVELSVTENRIQNPCTEPEVETVMSTECENPTPSTHQVEKCTTEIEVSESSQTSYILATDKQQSVCELKGDRNMDTEAVELSENEKQIARNKPEIECVKDAQSENGISYIDHKNEHDNEVETQESSETPDTPIPDKQEPISESTGECIMDTQVVEFYVTDNGTQKPCTEPEVETVMRTECENPTPSTHRVEKCAIEKEVSESSQTSYILATDKLQSVCELPGDKNMDTEAGELSEIEKQIACNEPEIECAKDAQNANEMSYIHHKNEHDNEVETQESSETPDTPMPDKQEPIRASTEESIMNTEVVELSVTENRIQNPCTEPEVETVMGTECENPTPSTHQVEKCATEKEVSESSQTLHILTTEKQQSVCELQGDRNMDTEAVELSKSEKQVACNEPEIKCAKDAQNANEMSYIHHKNEHDNEVETQESSETPDTPMPDKQEPVRASTGECIMNTEVVEFSVAQSGIQNPCTEPEVETVMGTECENPTPSTHQVEKCATEKEVSESSQTLHILATEKQQSVCELQGDRNMDTEAVELSKSEKQVACNEPEIECAKDAQSENKISYIDHKNEHDNEVETQESSETPDTPMPDKQEPIRASTEESIMNTEVVELPVTENRIQNPCTEPEVETVMGTECENPTPSTHQVEKCATEKEVSESSQTLHILATDKQQSVCELQGDRNMDTEAVELSKSEKQVACNEPEIGCAKDAQNANEMSYIDHKNEHDNEVETQESSETPDTPIPDKQEPIRASTGECIMNTEVVEFSVTDNGTQNPCSEPEVETVMGTECENPTSTTHQVEKSATEKEVSESSQMSYILATVEQQSVCELPGDKNMDTEAGELSEIEKQIACNEPEIECAKYAQSENKISYIDHKNEHDNEVETQESSETPDTPIPDKQEPIRASTGECIMNTEVVEFSVTDNGTQNLCSEPEVETVMRTECESPTPSTHQVEKCAIEKEVSESSQTLHILTTEKQQSVCELPGDKNMDTEAGELSEIEKQIACNEPEIECAKYAQSENKISYIDQKNEHDNEVKTQESSETPDTPIPDKQEPIRSSTEERIMNTEVVEFSVTDNGTQNPCSEPEVETVMGTECENPTLSTHQVEKCAIEKEVSESSQTLHILTTEKQQSVCELPGDKNMDTEAGELSEIEKQIACNEPEIECAKYAQSENKISYIHHKNEHDNEVETQESSETPDTHIPDKQEPIRASTEESIVNTEVVELSVKDNGTQNPCSEPEVETVMGTECENPTPSTHQVEKCATEKEVSESSQTLHISATDKQQSVCELQGDRNMDTEAVELSEIEKQVACNEPEIECAKDAQNANEMSYIHHKNEHDNEVETQESSETPDTPMPDKQEPVRASTGECIMNTEVVEFSVAQSGIQNPCTEPEVETVMGTECENPTPSTHQVEKCATEKEVSESSQMSYILATVKQQSVCELQGDRNMDTEAVELSKSEKQVACNEPEIGCAKDAQNANEMSYIDHKNEHDNEVETQESSETPNTPIPDKQEPISESTGECIMDKEAIAFSVTDNGTQDLCTEPEVETVMRTECESPTPSTHRVEKCAIEKEVSESSQTSYILATVEQQSVCELPGDKNMDTEAGELSEIEKQIACNEPEIECAKYAQSENKISYIDQKNEHDNEVETQESSETPDTPIPDKQEPISESTGECIMDKQAIAFSVTDNGTQDLCTEPEVETVMRTECENPTPSTHQVEKCAIEKEVSESSQTSYILATDKLQSVCELPGDKNMDTEAGELSEIEKQIVCNEPEIECAKDAQNANEMSYTYHKNEHDNEVETQESSETPDTPIPDKQEPISESTGECIMDKQAIAFSVTDNGTQNPCTEPEVETVMGTECENPTPSTHQVEKCATEKEVSESSQTLHILATEKQQSVCELPGDKNMDTEAGELSEIEKQIACNEPEIECAKDAQNANEMSYTYHKNEHDNEVETQESSETPDTPIPDKQEPISESTGECIMDKQAIAFSVTDNGTQDLCTEPEVETVMRTECESPTPFTHQVEKCAIEKEVSESSQTLHILTTEKQQSVCELPGDKNMDTEAGELSENEKQIARNKPEIECVKDAQSENGISYIDHKNEHDNEVETQESSETPDTPIPDKQEPICESTGECIMDKHAIAFSVTDNGTQNPCTEPEVETVMGTECENPTPSTHQVEKCATEKEVSESSQTLHILATEKQQSVCELPGDKNMDTEAGELSEIEKQIACNEPEIECAKDAQNANEMSCTYHKNEHDNEVDTQESSETPYTPIPEKQEPISESTGECIMDKQAIAFSVTDNGTQNPCTEPEVETLMGTECENPTPSTHQVEKCATEKEVSESSQTLHILATDKQQSVCELPGYKNMDTEAGELSEIEKQIACNEPEIECAKYAQSENKISYIDHKNEHDNEVETQESSETPYNTIPEKQEPISESTGECIMDKHAIAFSVTDNGTQNPCTEPEVETVKGTECEDPTPFTHQVEKCATEKEVSESSQTLHILATEKQQSVCELPGYKNMDTEAGELSEIEKQIACNEPEVDCAKYAQSENKISYIDHKNEHDNEVETQESSETPYNTIPEKQEPINESTGECIMDKQAIAFSVTDNGTQNPCSEPEVETVMGTECENPTPSTHQVEKCAIEKEVPESSQTLHILATEKQQSVCELPGYKNMDTEAGELSEIEKQIACNEPEIECAKYAQSENKISYIHHKNEHDNEVDTQESSETLYTPKPEKQETINESTGKYIMDTQVVEFYVTDNGTQKPCTEPEVETVKGTECEDPTPFTHQVEKCAIEKQVSESSQTSYILATEEQQSACELPGDRNMDKEAVELSESEKQIACNEPEIGCSNHAPSANEMSYIHHKNEHDNEVDTQESSETLYTPKPEKQETINESTGKYIMDTQVVEFYVTDNGTQKPCTEPEVETVMGTECENPTSTTHQVEKSATEKEVSESSQMSYILATVEQQSVCELPGDKNMDTEAGELSEIEKQIACNEPQIECAKDAQNANEMSYIDHKNEHDNEVETQESSETPDTHIPDTQEPISESKGECSMDKQAIAFSVTDNGTQNPCTEPEVETIKGTECGDPTPFTHQVEKCAIEQQVSESSQTSYILATDEQQSACELPGDRNMDKEAVELSENEKQTGNGTQNLYAEPEVETVMGTECENPT
ncbi:titin, partial [Bactrocera dorsalis]|uniref:Titin n=2 Tax=Bactrocera dorsalis TaxID=27457 RepID=A0ABM3JHK4_BACDO